MDFNICTQTVSKLLCFSMFRLLVDFFVSVSKWRYMRRVHFHWIIFDVLCQSSSATQLQYRECVRSMTRGKQDSNASIWAKALLPNCVLCCAVLCCCAMLRWIMYKMNSIYRMENKSVFRFLDLPCSTKRDAALPKCQVVVNWYP